MCAHCGAIRDDSSFCSICRKSPLEPVEELASEPATGETQPRPRVTALTATVGLIAVLTLIWAWTRADDTTTFAPTLPTPMSRSLTSPLLVALIPAGTVVGLMLIVHSPIVRSWKLYRPSGSVVVVSTVAPRVAVTSTPSKPISPAS